MRRRLGWATEQGRRRAAVLVAFGSGNWARGGTAPTAVARSEGRGDVAGQCDVGPAALASALRRPQQMRRGGANRGSESQSVMSSGGQLACAGLTFFAPSEERLESGLYSRSYLENQMAVALGGRCFFMKFLFISAPLTVAVAHSDGLFELISWFAGLLKR